MDIETVHNLLDQVEEAIEILADEEREWIEAAEAGDLCLIIGELMGWGGSAYYDEPPRTLGVRAVTVRKLHKLTGKVSVSEARVLATRLRSYLKSFDQKSPEEDPIEAAEAQLVVPIEAKLAFPGAQWASVRQTTDVKQKIHALSRILDDLLFDLKRSNNNPDDAIFSELDKQQLIAILQTTLNVLKSPMVEKGLLLKTREMLQKAAVNAAEKQAQQGFETLASHGVSWLSCR